MLTRLLRRLAWRLVREDVGAAILAAEQRQNATLRTAAKQIIDQTASTMIGQSAIMAAGHSHFIDSVVAILRANGIPAERTDAPATDLADSGFEVIPPSKLN